jgi:hypothetical protein
MPLSREVIEAKIVWRVSELKVLAAEQFVACARQQAERALRFLTGTVPPASTE